MFVVEDVSEVDDLIGVVAHGQHCDLVQNVHRAVAQRAVRPGSGMNKKLFTDGYRFKPLKELD